MSTSQLMQKYPLKREKILKKALGWALFPLFIMGFLGLIIFAILISSLSTGTLFLLLLVLAFMMAVIFAIAYWYESEYFKKYFYDLTGEGIVTRKGVFSTHGAIVPPNKVQDVYLDQDILDRVFGLWDLHVSSATATAGAEAHIDGISEASARELRQVLMSTFLPDMAKAGPASQFGGKTLKQPSPSGSGLLRIILGGLISLAFALLFLFPLWFIVLPLAIGGLAWAYLDFTVLRYEMRENGVFIRKGFINRSENLFLYKNIQDVIEVADFWDRIFGIKSLSIKTMTESSAVNAVMPYLPASQAPALREEILGLMRSESQKAEKAAKAKDVKAPAAMAMAISEKPAKNIPKIEERKAPYENHFFRGAEYTSLASILAIFSIAIAICLLVLIVGQSGFTLPILGLALLLSVIATAGAYVLAFISAISFDYTISPEFVLIKTGILNIVKKQVNYNKLQDLEKKVSFIDSFAGLATVKLETGSKELVNPKHGVVASATTQNETIPDLMEGDAEKLKHTLLGQMGFSAKGIGVNPLVSRLPLEAIKPLKKTFWWVIYSLVILVLIGGGILIFARAVSWLAGLLFLFLAAACILKYVYELYYYKKYFYDLNDQVLVIRKGVFGSRELIIPFEKIQDVFVDRDWLDLVFGLYDVYVSTVSSRSILNAHLDGLNEKNAEKAALLLLEKIK